MLRRSTRCYQEGGRLHTRSSSHLCCSLTAGPRAPSAASELGGGLQVPGEPHPGQSRAHGLQGSCSQEPAARRPVGTGRPRALRNMGGPSGPDIPAVDRLPACGTQPARGRPVCIPGPQGDKPLALPCTRPPSAWPPPPPLLGDELMDILGKNLRNASGIKPAFRGRRKGRGAEARMTRRNWEG